MWNRFKKRLSSAFDNVLGNLLWLAISSTAALVIVGLLVSSSWVRNNWEQAISIATLVLVAYLAVSTVVRQLKQRNVAKHTVSVGLVKDAETDQVYLRTPSGAYRSLPDDDKNTLHYLSGIMELDGDIQAVSSSIIASSRIGALVPLKDYERPKTSEEIKHEEWERRLRNATKNELYPLTDDDQKVYGVKVTFSNNSDERIIFEKVKYSGDQIPNTQIESIRHVDFYAVLFDDSKGHTILPKESWELLIRFRTSFAKDDFDKMRSSLGGIASLLVDVQYELKSKKDYFIHLE